MTAPKIDRDENEQKFKDVYAAKYAELIAKYEQTGVEATTLCDLVATCFARIKCGADERGRILSITQHTKEVDAIGKLTGQLRQLGDPKATAATQAARNETLADVVVVLGRELKEDHPELLQQIVGALRSEFNV